MRTRSCQRRYFAAISAASVNWTGAGGADRKIPSQPRAGSRRAGLAVVGSVIMPRPVDFLTAHQNQTMEGSFPHGTGVSQHHFGPPVSLFRRTPDNALRCKLFRV